MAQYKHHKRNGYHKKENIQLEDEHLLNIKPRNEAFCLQFGVNSAFGIWKRSWPTCFLDQSSYIEKLKKSNKIHRFTLFGRIPYALDLLYSWDVQFGAEIVLNDQYTLFPKYSLIQLTGFDNSGIYCPKTKKYETTLSKRAIKCDLIEIKEDEKCLKQLVGFYKKQLLKQQVLHRVKKVILIFKTLLNKIKS